MKFILTRELGRLAKWLRILGFDTLYFNQDNPGSLIVQALRDERIILTRNQRLPQARGVQIIRIRAETLKGQIPQVVEALNIKLDAQRMFTRCILCNEALTNTEKEKVKGRVPEYVFATQNDFVSCPKCKRIYWQGTHWGNVVDTLKEIDKNGIHR
jgi:uncharacterized protein with PIN domain